MFGRLPSKHRRTGVSNRSELAVRRNSPPFVASRLAFGPAFGGSYLARKLGA